MPAPSCYSSLQVCALRAARLSATGAPLPGAENLYETTALLQLGVSWTVAEGASFELTNGCGKTCASFQDCDRLRGVELSLELCHLDAELLELLTGGTLITSGGATVGFEVPGDNVCPDGVSLEVWSKAWDGDSQASSGADVLYYHFAFPKTTWVLGDFTLQNEILRVPLTAKGGRNPNFGNGPANDWPVNITSLMGYFLDTDLPAGDCGYQALAAS